MTETPATFPNPEISKIIPYTGSKIPKTDMDMTYLENNNIDEAVRYKLRKKYVYKTYMHNIYNLIIGQTNKKIQEKASSDAAFQVINTYQDPIGYLMILKNICFSNQLEEHPTCSLCLTTRRLHNAIQYASKNTTNYLVIFRNTQKIN